MPLSVDETLPTNQYEFNYPRVYISQPGSPFNCHHDSYGSPMHAAAAYGHTEVVKLLVENNAAINSGQIERPQRDFGVSHEQRWCGVGADRGLL